MQHVGAGGQVFPITGTHAYNFPDAIIAPELESSIDQSSFSSYQPVAGPELNNNIYTTVQHRYEGCPKQSNYQSGCLSVYSLRFKARNISTVYVGTLCTA